MTSQAASNKSFKSLFALTRGHNDLLLAGLLIAIVSLFVLPLPTFLIDLLITANLAISLGILMVSMYVTSALNLSTFPSLLLFTTLFRLALNVASTKLILLHADAGHIIDTFGKLIVGNNVVVGGVVFLIIAIVQFIVIAKGSERVAEVAARFALDAMPGKQMSIDADVRAGVMSSSDAQRRRRLLEDESQLHGAMDGAMKFVKGDAIAGIVIALINILAGVAIGTLMHGMAVGDAMQRYAVLTIGDGMVSQIPSLLVSIAAGLVITRVGSSGDPRNVHLATQIGRQVLAYPRALVVTGVALSSFLLVPGFPKWTFGIWAFGAIAIGLYLLTSKQLHRTPDWIKHADPGDTKTSGEEAVASALAVQLSPSLRGLLDRQLFDRSMAASRSTVEIEMGLVFPLLQMTYSELAPGSGYQILVQDVVVSSGTLRPGWWMVDPNAPDVSAVQGGETLEPFGPFNRVVLTKTVPAGIRALSCEEVLVTHVEAEVRSHVARLIGIQDVQRLLHRVQRDAPDLAAEVSRVVPLPRITEVLQRLLRENVPIRNLRFIFESLVAWAPNEQDTAALTELVRADMGRYITSRYVTADRRLDAIMFDAKLLERLQSSLENTQRGTTLTLSPAATHELREQLRQLLATSTTAAKTAVVVVPLEIRRYVRKMLVQPVAPSIPVLSYQELEEDVALQPIGWVSNPQVT